jgi:hypothetical protein
VFEQLDLVRCEGRSGKDLQDDVRRPHHAAKAAQASEMAGREDVSETEVRKAIAWALRQLPLRSPKAPRQRSKTLRAP